MNDSASSANRATLGTPANGSKAARQSLKRILLSPRAGPWRNRNSSSPGVERAARRGELGIGVEQVGGHELEDQRHVHVHGALELRQAADVTGGHLEEHVALEALGGHHVPELVDHPLALGRHLHLRRAG